MNSRSNYLVVPGVGNCRLVLPRHRVMWSWDLVNVRGAELQRGGLAFDHPAAQLFNLAQHICFQLHIYSEVNLL